MTGVDVGVVASAVTRGEGCESKTGAVSSTMVTVKIASVSLPELSSAVQVTRVSPNPNVPDAGEQLMSVRFKSLAVAIP